ncbi:hypothetical protein BTO04_06785 [Polaribacter sp. SA4-10]|uniref:hypothetical protein n=1 Tax=Polaribacter sp. SA4-10 TaxID=754397 RepID=UPI000B3CADED|nr:hypothetical protein [Polaribacter sp. SA4-10]ARV06422.1 hypothetical protein BTO04_06785 [Polaribacter sp. SA4-10]
MKKLLIMAMCIATGVAFSQHEGGVINPNVINPNGQTGMIDRTMGTPVEAIDIVNNGAPTAATCEVDQVLMPEDFIRNGRNRVLIRQVGNLNEANGTQVGLGNESLIRQNNTNFIPGEEGNLASTDQTGYRNGAQIKQFGDGNDGRIEQLGNDNYAVQDVGADDAMHAEGSFAYASQTGNDNRISQKQRYDNNEATALSWGDGNTIVQDQSTGANQASGSVAFASQVGDENGAQQVQRGSNNYASAYQTGNGNTSVETQTMVGDSSEFMNLSTVNQVGDDNISCVTQNADMANNSSLVNQIGNENSSLVSQTGDLGAKSASCIKQTGNLNTAQVTQISTPGSHGGH